MGTYAGCREIAEAWQVHDEKAHVEEIGIALEIEYTCRGRRSYKHIMYGTVEQKQPQYHNNIADIDKLLNTSSKVDDT